MRVASKGQKLVFVCEAAPFLLRVSLLRIKSALKYQEDFNKQGLFYAAPLTGSFKGFFLSCAQATTLKRTGEGGSLYPKRRKRYPQKKRGLFVYKRPVRANLVPSKPCLLKSENLKRTREGGSAQNTTLKKTLRKETKRGGLFKTQLLS